VGELLAVDKDSEGFIRFMFLENAKAGGGKIGDDVWVNIGLWFLALIVRP